MEEEIFKDIIWYEGLYQVSNKGNIKSLDSWRRKKWIQKILKSSGNNKWYLQVNLSNKWKIKKYLIHRLVAFNFLENPKNKPDINHINGIKNDNRLENIEWCTKSENAIHSVYILWNKGGKSCLWKFWRLHYSSKRVNQYDLEWNLIKIWDCIMDIQRELKINNWNISSCCKWKYWYKSAWWFIWKYLQNQEFLI